MNIPVYQPQSIASDSNQDPVKQLYQYPGTVNCSGKTISIKKANIRYRFNPGSTSTDQIAQIRKHASERKPNSQETSQEPAIPEKQP
jgi:ribosomal protein S16